MKAYLASLSTRTVRPPASRSGALKVAVRLQPTGQACPTPAASRQRRLIAPPQSTSLKSRQGRAPEPQPSFFGIRASDSLRISAFEFRVSLLLFGLAAGLLAQQPAPEEGRSRFYAVDIYVASGTTPLAAYQLEFAATNGVARIVGVEGGEHPAFRQPPIYDPNALQHDRVIIAGFSTAAATTLPTGNTRVATIHYQTTDTQPPQFALKLQAAGDPQGNRISAQASFTERKTQ
jgi:hypothetical protein